MHEQYFKLKFFKKMFAKHSCCHTTDSTLNLEFFTMSGYNVAKNIRIKFASIIFNNTCINNVLVLTTTNLLRRIFAAFVHFI